MERLFFPGTFPSFLSPNAKNMHAFLKRVEGLGGEPARAYLTFPLSLAKVWGVRGGGDEGRVWGVHTIPTAEHLRAMGRI